jgi:hypothetical protein
MSEWFVACSAFVERPYPTAKEAEEAAERFDRDGLVEVACGPHRARQLPNPLRVGRPSKPVSEMTDAERRAYAAEVVEVMRQDRADGEEIKDR